MARAYAGLLAITTVLASTSFATPALADWSGVYIGGSIGPGWVDGDVSYVTPLTAGPFSYDFDGVTAGGHIGGQMQWGSWVLGLEGTLRGGDLDGSTSCNVGNNDVCEFELDHLWAVMGRVGWATPGMLFFATGGYAQATFDMTRRVFPPAINLNPSFGTFDHAGYEVGAGFEWMLSECVIAGVEYQHIGLNSQNERVVRNDGAFATFRNEPNIDSAQFRLSFKF